MGDDTKQAPTVALQLSTLLVMFVALAPIGSWLFRGEGLAALIGREAVFWIITAGLIAYVAFAERRPLSSISLRAARWSSLAIGIAGGAVTTGGMAAIYLVVVPALPQSESNVSPALLSTPLWLLAAVVLRAAIFEEIFFRGFMIERLSELTHSRWLAAALSLTAFTLSHRGGWGPSHLVVAGVGGLILTGLYIWKRDLLVNMVAHFTTNAVGLLLR